MSYKVGGLVEAATYNYFVGFINSIYSDSFAGSTNPSSAAFGYGIGTNLPAVNPTINPSAPPPYTPAEIVTAVQWTNLFDRIVKIGLHQGTSTNPIPALVKGSIANPHNADLIAAFNDYTNSTTLKEVISQIAARKCIMAVSQRILNLAPPAVSPTIPAYTWTSGSQYSFQVDFTTWDNARHFFNLGGAITINGNISGGGSADAMWASILAGMGTITFNWQGAQPGGSGPSSNKGFYFLTTSYQEVFRKTPHGGSAYYVASYISVNAKLNAAAGVNGKIDFQFRIVDASATPPTKTGTITTNIGNISSGGAVPYPGPAVITNAGLYTPTFTPDPPGIHLSVAVSPETIQAESQESDTPPLTTSVITAQASGGTAPYTYVWANFTSAPNVVTFNPPAPQTSSGPVSVTFSRVMESGGIAVGVARVTVTDSASNVATTLVNWGMANNHNNTPL
jgi:hypothetical protein